MAFFNIDYVTADETVKTSHRIHVDAMTGETDWEALLRVVQSRGLKLLRARTSEANISLDLDDESVPITDAQYISDE